MKKKTVKYTLNREIKDLKVVRDGLPPIHVLAIADELVTISVPMSKKSIEFFKKSAKKEGTSYIQTIGKLVDTYAKQFLQHS